MYYTSKETYEFISRQTNDPIVERKTCEWTGVPFPIFQGDINLLKKVSPKIGGTYYDLPLPKLSPQARHIRRLMWRNDRKLYKSIDFITKQPIITYYHPALENKITDSDERYRFIDNSRFGQDFDFSKTLGEQIAALMLQTIKQNTLKVGFMENSIYSHNAGDFKNCYMTFDGGICENVMYTTRVAESKNIIDGFEIFYSENIYNSISITNSNTMFRSQNCDNCNNGAFLFNCGGSHHCIASTNLSNKSYYIFNKPVSKEEFNKVRNKLFSGNPDFISTIQKEYENILQGTVLPSTDTIGSENSIGHNLYNCNNVILSLEAHGSDNSRYVYKMNTYDTTSYNMDINSRGGNMQYCYELNCAGTDRNTNMINTQFGSYLFWGVYNTQYSINVPQDTHDVFACSDIQGKRYCILNKQYSKTEYLDLIPKIINHLKQTGERGEFFDPRYSPFPYNDTIANDYYPIKHIQYPNEDKILLNPNGLGTMLIRNKNDIISDAILDLGGSTKIHTKRRNKDYEVDIPQKISLIQTDQLDSLSDEKLLTSAIKCAISSRPYRIVKLELEFYRKYGLPLPKLHPDIRHKNRLKKCNNTLNLHKIVCKKCGKSILSVYPQDSGFNIYCQQCYKTYIV